MFYRCSAQWDVRRLALLAVALLQVVASGAMAPLSVLADQDETGLPVHLEPPGDADCPAAHNHLVCQAVRSLATPVAAPLVGTATEPGPSVVVSWTDTGGVAYAGLEFLVGSVIPRGPPQV